MKKRLWLVAATVVAAASVVGAAASAPGTPSFDRGLPTTNLNNAAGASRSNVAWSNGNDYVSGDSFAVGAGGETWLVTQIRTWTVPNDTGTGTFHFGNEYSSVALYFGPGAISQIASGTVNLGADVNNNANIAMTPTSYAGGSDYQGSSGTFYRLWQIDFKNLGQLVNGGQTYFFAVDGAVTNPHDYWFNHASNAALSGSPQQGADDHWVAWAKSGLSTPNSCDSGAPSVGVCDGGWDKSSDINVQVFASQVVTNKDLCKDGGWQNVVGRDGTTFKNQGDCIQYANTGK